MSVFDSETDQRSQILHMKKIQAEGLELFIRKNADYGDSYKQHGLVGVLVRLQDKINRAMHVSKHSIHVNESLRDTLIDLHNYAAMAIMESESEPTVPSLPFRTYGSEPPLSEPMGPILHIITTSEPYSVQENHCINSEPLSLPYQENHCINLRD
jgi:hypothetical protein